MREAQWLLKSEQEKAPLNSAVDTGRRRVHKMVNE